MKNSKLKKLIAVVASVVLLIGVAVAFTVMADSETIAPVYTDEVGIAALNISYKAQTELAFAVLDNENAELAEGETREVYLLFFNADPDAAGELDGETLYRKAVARKTAAGTVKVDGVEHLLFYSNGVKANDLFKNVYVCPVVVVRGESDTTYTRGYTVANNGALDYSARACSVAGYARQKIVEAAQGADISSDQLALYSNILRYANSAADKSASAVKGDEFVVVNGGGYIFGLDVAQLNVTSYADDAKLALTAAPKNADGEYFLSWSDMYGNTVSSSRTITIDAHNDIGYVLYTAIYGDASASPYDSAITFDDYALGSVVDLTPPTSAGELSSGYKNHKATVDAFEFENRVWWTLNSATSLYELTKKSTVDVVENTLGKALQLAKPANTFMPQQKVNNTMDDTANAVEFDLRVAELNNTGRGIRVDLVANGFTFTLAVRTYYDANTDEYTVKLGSIATGLNGSTSTKYVFNESLSENATPVETDANAIGYSLGESIDSCTIRCVIDDSGAAPVAKAYVNGELVFIGTGAKTGSWNYGYFNTASTAYTKGGVVINQMKLQLINGGSTLANDTVATYELDNILFVNER